MILSGILKKICDFPEAHHVNIGTGQLFPPIRSLLVHHHLISSDTMSPMNLMILFMVYVMMLSFEATVSMLHMQLKQCC
jgi:hypothetical protein